MISFFVPGVPKPGGSKRAFVNPKTGRAIITDDCKGNRDWRAVVADSARLHTGDGPPLDCPLRLEVVFHLLRPKGHFGSGKNAGQVRSSAPAFPTVKPDTTKLLRALEDALTGIIWRDDALVVEQEVSKRYSDRTGAEVRVFPLMRVPV